MKIRRLLSASKMGSYWMWVFLQKNQFEDIKIKH